MKTKKPSKQRKRLYKLSLHQIRKRLVAPLDKAVAKSIGKKRLVVRTGDTIKVLTGKHKGKTGKVEKVDYTRMKVYIKEIKFKNVKGQERLVPFVASNLLLTNVLTEDRRRLKIKNPQKEKVK